MKLATFLLEKGNSKKQRFGALLNQGGILLELSLAARLLEGKAPKALSSALDLMDGGEKALDHARELLAKAEKNAPEEALFSPDEITLLAPVPRPRSIRDCMGFEEHVIQATQTVLSWRFPPLAMANDLARRVTGRPLVKPPRVWYEQPLFTRATASPWWVRART